MSLGCSCEYYYYYYWWENNLIQPNHSETVSYEEIFPGNFGVGGVKKFLEKKSVSFTRKFSGKKSSPKISSPKISSGSSGSNSPSRGNFEAQNFLETGGIFTWKILDHLITELKSVPFPRTG